MVLIAGVVLLALGGLAASSSIVARRPDAQKYIEMLRPYQGWVGFGACLLGLWIILSSLWHLNSPDWVPLWWLTYAIAGVLLAGLGFLLGYPLLSQHILSRNPGVARQSEAALAKLTPYQVNLGYLAIAFAVWTLVARVVWGTG